MAWRHAVQASHLPISPRPAQTCTNPVFGLKKLPFTAEAQHAASKVLSLHRLFVIVHTHELHNIRIYNHIYTDMCMSVAISTLTTRHSFYFLKRRLGKLSCYKEPTFCSTGETAAGLGWEISAPQLQVQLPLIETRCLLLRQNSSPW